MKIAQPLVTRLAMTCLVLSFAGLLPAQTPDKALVKMTTYLSTSKVPVDGTCDVLVVLKIQEGWHVNSNPANPSDLPATQFTIVATEGTKLTDVQYPKSKTITMDGIDSPVHVYDGEVAIFGKLSAPESSAGKTESLEMKVVYQACNHEVCRPPATVSIKGKVPVASKGESLEPQNGKVFEHYRPRKEQKTK